VPEGRIRSFQIVVRASSSGLANVNVTVSDLTSGAGQYRGVFAQKIKMRLFQPIHETLRKVSLASVSIIWLLLNVSPAQSQGTIATIAGNGSPGFAGSGSPPLAASLNYPGGITVDAAGNLYFNDDVNYRTRRIATDGTISTIAGTGAPGFSGDGGPATAASLNGNFGITLDPLGNLYIADSVNNRIREVYAVVPVQ